MYSGIRTARRMPLERRKTRRARVAGLLLVILLPIALVFGFWKLWQLSRPAAPRQTVSAAASQKADAAPLSAEKDAAAAAAPAVQPTQVTLMALGDNLIHNTVYWSAQKPDGSYDFTPMYADIRPVVQEYDIACINQETIFVKDPAQYSNYPAFGGPTQVGDALAWAGFDVVEQATNHCYDKLDTGIHNTLDFWRQSHPEMTVLGIHDSEADAEKIRVVEKNGIRIAMLNYTYGLNYSAPANRWMVDTLWDREKIADDIARAKAQSDFVIVFAHWGEEGSTTPSDEQRSLAQFFADQGVGLVIGGHVHVLQPLETFTGSGGSQMPVYFSLGNFLSHQDQAKNMLGGMASVTIRKDDSGTRAVSTLLYPTVTLIEKNPSARWYLYRPMLLIDYTDDLAKLHILPGTGVNDMWDLYHSIIPAG
jgi:poly-gamma-glutamate capsule biosynthesis protein CapA/YwtB (metallophosphatase superfamily)